MIEIQVNATSALKAVGGFDTPKRVRAAMEEATAYLEREVDAGMPVDQGAARESVRVTVSGSPINLTGRLWSPLPHVAVIEEGRRPGSTPPPVEPIRRWLERRGMDGRLAFVVARAIGRRGQPPQRVFRRAFERSSGRIQAIFRKHLAA